MQKDIYKKRYMAMREEKLGAPLASIHRQDIMESKCKNCDRKYIKRVKWRKYCSKKCSNEYFRKHLQKKK